MADTIECEMPMVSIWCPAYNHEKFIRRCLDGFVMQKTNFKFEAIVHDDASTDNTARIIQEYADKYPDIIKPIFEKENQYSKHDGSLRRIMKEHMRGKYVASCEGDDYWTDAHKLQLQVDFMEAHNDVSMCFHNAYLYDQRQSKIIGTQRIYKNNIYADTNVIFRDGGFIPTNSIMFRSEFLSKACKLSENCPVGDLPLQITMAISGKVYYMNVVMSCYRIGNDNSATSIIKSNNQKYINHHMSFISWYKEIDAATEYQFHKEISEAIIFSEARILIAKKKYKQLSDNKYYIYIQNLPLTQRIGLMANIAGFGWISKFGHSILTAIRKII